MRLTYVPWLLTVLLACEATSTSSTADDTQSGATANDAADSSAVDASDDGSDAADTPDAGDSDGADARDGADVPDGVVDGADGRDGRDSADGADGSDGRDGADSADGAVGSDARDGQDGSDGLDSVDGADTTDFVEGSDSPDGADGAPGADSADGTIDSGDGTNDSADATTDATDGTTDAADGPTDDGTDASDGTTNDCPSDLFLNVAAGPGAGAAYPKPTLSVVCTETTVIVESNGIPQYTFVAITPNALKAQTHHWEIPRNPTVASETTDIPLLGAIGLTVNGQAFMGPNEAAQPAAMAFGDPVYNGIMDECNGHTANEYHYHALVQKCLIPSALVSEPWNNADVSTTAASPVLGFAFDGFRVYGRYGCLDAACSEVVEFKSGYQKIGDPTKNAWSAYKFVASNDPTVLDECNGRVGPDGVYRYHETAGFPYIIGCYAGAVSVATDGGDIGADGPADGSDGPPDGSDGLPPDGSDGPTDGSDGPPDGTDGPPDGTDGTEGTDGGTPPGPKSCTTTADCTASCPATAKGCTCAQTPMGKLCIPTCTVDADCPKPPGQPALICDASQKCAPKGP